MDKVRELEIQLEKLKAQEVDKKWAAAVKRLRKLGDMLTGKDVIRWSSSSCFHIYRIAELKENYYADCSGFYGQWDKRRWIALLSKSFRVDGWSGNISLSHEIMKGIPLAPKQTYGKVYPRFVSFGMVQANTAAIEIGEEAYKDNDYNAVDKAVYDFLSGARYAPKGLYDQIEEMYIRHNEDTRVLKESVEGLKLKPITI